MTKNICLIICFELLALYSSATNYYLSNNGNDANNGKAPNKSFKTIDRVNKQRLLPGDSVLFKCGDVFSGQIIVQYSGKENKPIVYTAYGNGNAPVISGSIEINNWQPYQENILKATILPHVYNLFVDGEMQTDARFPNKGLLKIDGGFNNTIAFADNDLTQQNGYWLGATIRFRTWDWEYRTSTVTDYTDKKITIKDSSTNTPGAGWGYYFDNKMSELDTLHEWFNDTTKHSLYYIPSTKNMATQKVEATVFSSAFIIIEKIKNIVVKELSVQQFDKYGVWAKGDNEAIVIINNHFENINLVAINFNLVSKNCVAKNNRIKNINGRGISALEPEHLQIADNNISHIGYIPGYGISGVNGMIGIAIENIEKTKSATDHIAQYNLIKGNSIDSCGYVAIRMDGTKSIMENNVLGNSLLQLSDGAAIYCWAKDGTNYTYDNIIRNNIVYNITGSNIGTPSESNPIANGIYIDNNCYHILVEGNTVFNSTGSGIHINSDAFNNTVTNNTVYNCQTAMSIAEWAKPNTTFGNKIEHNIFFAINQSQRCVGLSNWLMPSTKKLGTFNHNTYINLTEKYILTESFLTEDKSIKVRNEFSYEGWKKNYGFDQQSSLIGTDHALAQYQRSAIFYNETNVKKMIDTRIKDYFDLEGKKITALQSMPFASAILLYK